MDVNVSLPESGGPRHRRVTIVLVLLLAWIGGEAHYGNCLEKAAVQYPASSQASPTDEAAREDAISSCSRWP